MVRTIPGWPSLIEKCRSSFPRGIHWSLTGRSGKMESGTLKLHSFKLNFDIQTIRQSKSRAEPSFTRYIPAD